MRTPSPGRLSSFAAALVALSLVAGVAVADGAPAFSFSTGDPDGRMAMASRQGGSGIVETEAADDFVLTAGANLEHASFTGLLPSGTLPSTITSVTVRIYRAFPVDSANPPSGNVPARVGSPSDVVLAARDGVTSTVSTLAASFAAANSVDNGIHRIPNQTTAGEGAVTGEEVRFDVTFGQPLSLDAGHYFFVPQVSLPTGHFLWLSAPTPILSPGTPFSGDQQTWMRNADVSPDWLRVGTDIVGGATPPTFNATFSLSGTLACPTVAVAPSALPAGVVGSPYAAAFTASGGSPPYAFTVTGRPPAGVSFAATGALAGTPSQLGAFPLTITATDATGCRGNVTPTLTIGPAAAAGPGPGPGTGATAPALAALTVSPPAFRAGSTGGSIARASRTGTTISYRDSQAATTGFTVLAGRRGARSGGGACVRPGTHAQGRRCTRYVSIGSFTHGDVAGRNSFRFTGRLGGRKLRPAGYRLRALPSANGVRGRAATIPFRIVR